MEFIKVWRTLREQQAEVGKICSEYEVNARLGLYSLSIGDITDATCCIVLRNELIKARDKVMGMMLLPRMNGLQELVRLSGIISRDYLALMLADLKHRTEIEKEETAKALERVRQSKAGTVEEIKILERLLTDKQARQYSDE